MRREERPASRWIDLDVLPSRITTTSKIFSRVLETTMPAVHLDETATTKLLHSAAHRMLAFEQIAHERSWGATHEPRHWWDKPRDEKDLEELED